MMMALESPVGAHGPPGPSSASECYRWKRSRHSRSELYLDKPGDGSEQCRVIARFGSFTFPSVTPGTYSLKIEAAGFEELTLQNIIVTAK
jgi:hypothetical protein